MSDHAYNSEELDKVRKQIDELDNRIHDTLMERAELVLKIGAEKRKKNIQIVQPAREARMIRRLLNRHQGALPEMAVVRIWRELVGAVSLLQTGLKVNVTAPEGVSEYWDLARDYFGSCLPMQKSGSAMSALADVREEKCSFAVVPWPETEEENPWWSVLKEHDDANRLHIIARLPHGDDPDDPAAMTKALVVSKSGFDSSDDDHSFLFIECAQNVSRGKLVDVSEKLGMKALSLSSRRAKIEGQPCQHLLEVDRYLDEEDDLIARFQNEIEDEYAHVFCAGGYPTPPVYSKTVTSEDKKKSDKDEKAA